MPPISDWTLARKCGGPKRPVDIPVKVSGESSEGSHRAEDGRLL